MFERNRMFKPQTATRIEAPDLDLILGNRINNPNMEKSDYSFFVANGLPYKRSLEELGDYISSLQASSWYGKFSCSGHSHIVLPGKYSIYINTANRQIRIAEPKCLFHDSDDEKMLLATDISASMLINIVACHFPTYAGLLAQYL